MANPYFEFKQFKVYHDQCGMKVCTEACILGAYADVTGANYILDIGTGTGLLSLMIAQRSVAQIDAVEIEADAFLQASANVQHSPWHNQINVFHSSIQSFTSPNSKKYDVIVSNPPFFSKHLKSGVVKNNLAIHNDTLPFVDLLYAVKHLLADNGKFIVLLPAYETGILEETAIKYNLFPESVLHIYHSEVHPLFRIITTFTKDKISTFPVSHLMIRDLDNNYSQEFSNLLQNYYLIF